MPRAPDRSITALFARHIRAALWLAMAALGFASAARSAPASRDELVYIGTQGSGAGQGIVAARFNTRTGHLSAVGLAAEVERPTWLAAHPTHPILYAVSDVRADPPSEGYVLTFQANLVTGVLNAVGKVSSGGVGPTFLHLDTGAKTVLVANFGTGSVAALPLLTGNGLGAPVSIQTDRGSGPTPRQKGPHAHSVVLDRSGRFAVVADFGADRIFVYRYDRRSHMLASDPAIEPLPPGTGPRHLAFDPSGRFLFVVSELRAEIRVYGLRGSDGTLTLLQTVATTFDPANAATNKGAEVALSADGRFVYISNRGEDTIVAYSVDRQSGLMREVQRIATGGHVPWSFALQRSGRWMLVANQASNTIAVLSRDPSTGRLASTNEALTVEKPVSVAFLAGGVR